MKLFAICWQDSSEPWGWAPATPDTDDPDGLPPQCFFWDRDEADEALHQHVDRMVPQEQLRWEEMREVRERVRKRNYALAVARGPVSLPGAYIRMPGESIARGIDPAAEFATPEPPVDVKAIRGYVEREWSVQEYDVPVPGWRPGDDTPMPTSEQEWRTHCAFYRLAVDQRDRAWRELEGR